MRTATLIVAAALIGGCASKPVLVDQPLPQTHTTTTTTASAALAFDPPVTMSEPQLDLSRSTRGAAAFAGFEDSTVTYFYVRTDDRQTTDNSERFARDGFSAKVGAIRR
jgi:hypothetical protein